MRLLSKNIFWNEFSMTIEIVDVYINSSSEEPFCPHNFAELLQHLRLRSHLSIQQLAKTIHFSPQSILAYESVLRNPTLKTLSRYIQRLHLELSITSMGITIRDPKTETLIVDNWSTNFR
jgi:DNA-binding XRE family transcriptional regulator